jgi:hypothetical protein
MKRLVIATAVTGFLSLSALAQKAPEPFVAKNSSEMTFTPSVLPGVTMTSIEGDPTQAGPFIYRARYSPNSKVAPHTHPNTEYVTVISGTFYLGQGEKFDEANGIELPAGSIGVIQAKVPHFAFAKGEAIVQVHGVGPVSRTWVDPKDDPTKKN